MSRSQETFNKKQREKERDRKKKMKREKRDSKKENSGQGLTIDWSSAPENKTLSQSERKEKDDNRLNNTNT